MPTAKAHTRVPLNTRQRTILMSYYNQNPYPTASQRQQLVELTGRTSKQIQDWFSNRRRIDSKLTTVSTPRMFMPPMYYYPPTPCLCPYCFFQTPTM